jgi:hypothetical protein
LFVMELAVDDLCRKAIYLGMNNSKLGINII